MTTPVLALSTRTDVHTGEDVIESLHHGHVVVCRGEGDPVALGDADRPTFVRSAAKPFQAAACIDVLGDDAGTLPDALTAVSWASHRGEPEHLTAVRALCDRAGISPDALTCPPARPDADATAGPTRLHHNCSGKHALFALAGRRLGAAGADLIDPSGPLQQVILERLGAELGPLMAVGIDGCGAPAVSVSLRSLATAYARASRAEGVLGHVVGAGLAHPHLVGGRGRIETALLAHGVLAKVGADGVYGVARDGLGLAVKIDGGNGAAAAAVVFAFARALGWLPEHAWSLEAVLGGGEPVGLVRPAPELEAFARTVTA